MTGQLQKDSYANEGAVAAVSLVNALTPSDAGGKPVSAGQPLPAIRRVLATDPQSVAQLDHSDVPGFIALARQLLVVFDETASGDVDAAAYRLNTLLSAHPAVPHLAKEDGKWRLHHHPVGLALVPMWTSICAEGLARVVGADQHDRLGTCAGTQCDRVFLDVSKNATRRYCSTACQNRMKAAAFRHRQRPEAATDNSPPRSLRSGRYEQSRGDKA